MKNRLLNLTLTPSLIPSRSIGLDVHRDRIYVTELFTLEGTYKQNEISTQDKEFEAFLATLRSDD